MAAKKPEGLESAQNWLENKHLSNPIIEIFKKTEKIGIVETPIVETWYRLRLGPFVNKNEAQKIVKSKSLKNKFKDLFIISR